MKQFDIKKIDMTLVKRYTSPQAVKDFDRFLDAMPMNVGYTALIIAGLIWMMAGGAVFFASSEMKGVTKLRAELLEVESLQPPVPQIEYIAVPKAQLEESTKKIAGLYPGVTIIVQGEGKATVSGTAVNAYPQFRAAINHLQNSGINWRTQFETLCLGRECSGSSLSAAIKIEVAHVTNVDLDMIRKKKPEDAAEAAVAE